MSARVDHPNAGELARQFADGLRILMYGDCDMAEQIQLLANTLATYDGVPASAPENHLLNRLILARATP